MGEDVLGVFNVFLVLLLAGFFFSGDCATSYALLEEGLLEFSIFAVQGAADLTSVFFKGQSWNEQRTKSHDWLVKTGFVMLTCPYFSLPHICISVNIEIFCV